MFLYFLQAYVFYMKYVQIVSQIRRSKDYQGDKKYYDAMLSNGKVKFALDRAEVLGKNLEKRYDLAKVKIEPRENGSARKITPPPVKSNDVPTLVKPANTMTNGVANSGEHLNNFPFWAQNRTLKRSGKFLYYVKVQSMKKKQ